MSVIQNLLYPPALFSLIGNSCKLSYGQELAPEKMNMTNWDFYSPFLLMLTSISFWTA